MNFTPDCGKISMKKPSHFYFDKAGYINGKILPDGYFFLHEIYVYPKYRGKGHAKRLMGKIPQKAKLLAQPLYKRPGKILSRENLIAFYESLGFRLKLNKNDNAIMIRD